MIDHVLTATRTNAQNGSKIYHEPDPDNPDRPKCDDHRSNCGKWLRKDPEMIPHHRVCKDCTGESGEIESRNDLWAELQHLDADDVGGSA